MSIFEWSSVFWQEPRGGRVIWTLRLGEGTGQRLKELKWHADSVILLQKALLYPHTILGTSCRGGGVELPVLPTVRLCLTFCFSCQCVIQFTWSLSTNSFFRSWIACRPRLATQPSICWCKPSTRKLSNNCKCLWHSDCAVLTYSAVFHFISSKVTPIMKWVLMILN